MVFCDQTGIVAMEQAAGSSPIPLRKGVRTHFPHNIGGEVRRMWKRQLCKTLLLLAWIAFLLYVLTIHAC